MLTHPCVHKDIACLKIGNGSFLYGYILTSDSKVVMTYIDTIPVNYSTHATSYPICPPVLIPHLANG
jgi:hypothetical protein